MKTRAISSLLACLAAQAAVVPALSLEQLIDQSEVIVHGRVARSWSAWDSAHKHIWTHHLIEVIDRVRGAEVRSIVASEPGGELDGVGMRFSGSIAYAVGEETIVFLYRTPIGYLRATGNGQGKYTITSGKRVRANVQGLVSPLDGLTVEAFKARVRESLRSDR